MVNFSFIFDPSSHLQNTKSYLFVAIQALLGKFFGWNEWTLRSPTILSAIALLWLIYVFIYTVFNDRLWAITSSMVLLVIPYFVCPHMAFTGDHDVPLTMFLTGFLVFYYLF
jgi:4-amino-4-deoxy-L-arabinose transferase-like glycosyltransferase